MSAAVSCVLLLAGGAGSRFSVSLLMARSVRFIMCRGQAASAEAVPLYLRSVNSLLTLSARSAQQPADHPRRIVHHGDDPPVVDPRRADHTDRADDPAAIAACRSHHHGHARRAEQPAFG